MFEKSTADYLRMLANVPMPLPVRLENYAAMFGLTVEQKQHHRIDLNMESILKDAIALLEPGDREWLNTMPIRIVHNHIRQVASERNARNRRGVAAVVANAETVEDSGGKAILIYAASMRATRPGLTRAEYVEWMRRLLLHELGHARDHLTDKDMAERFGY